MSVNLNIVSNFQLASLGAFLVGQQGLPGGGSATTDPFLLAVNGKGEVKEFSLATATAQKMWDSSTSVFTTFSYIHFVADQNFYLQFITSATNFILVATAGIPFVMSSQSILAAANTTAMVGTAPSVTAIAKIYIQQNSGSTANGQFSIIN
jgi:hypothetical protein